MFGFERHQLPMIRQDEISECGLACLAMIINFFGRRIDLMGVRLKAQNFRGEYPQQSMAFLMELSGHYGLECRALKARPDLISKVKKPCILHWDQHHFVVLKKVGSKHLTIHDPAMGERIVPWEEFKSQYSGVVLELWPSDKFERIEDKGSYPKMTLKSYLEGLAGLGWNLSKLGGLSILLLVFTGIGPYFSQIFLDKVLLQGSTDWLMILISGMLTATVLTAGIGYVRSVLLISMTQAIHAHLGHRVLRHLLALPLSWFQNRHIGDVVSRFGSTEQIKEILTGTLLASIVDGLLAITLVGVMFFYSIKVTLISLCFVLIYALIRLISYPKIRLLSEDALWESAKVQSVFLEAIKGVQSLKLFSKEPDFAQSWRSKYLNQAKSERRLGLKLSRLNVTESLFSALENALTTYLMAQLVFDREITGGMFVAFFSYQTQFATKSISLIGHYFTFKMLDLHLSRLADITETKIELLEAPKQGELTGQPLSSWEIDLQEISFRYPGRNQWVLKDFSGKIAEGECVAIEGPSGCGKTTLAKIILGLLTPDHGRVLVGGSMLEEIGLGHHRRQCASVMQDDHLFSGTIIDNITFFDPHPDPQRLWEVLELALLSDEIRLLPLQLHTYIGDMGLSLSGGQRQRLLIARALYRATRILLLDEATSHMDVQREQKINESLKKLPLTRVIIAHRLETLRMADRVISLPHGV